MPKKQVKKRTRRPNKIVRGLKQAVAYQAEINARNNASLNQEVALPSHDAMGLAEMVLDRISKKRGKGESKGEVMQIVVAEMLESAIAVRRAQAEAGGLQKGISEATEALERQIIEGVMARVDLWGDWRSLPPAIIVASRDMQVIVKALRKAGYRQERHTEQRAWAVRRVADGKVEAKYEKV